MFDSFSNIIFIFVALTIFIVRAIVQAKKKPEEPPPIPVHFEDEEPEYFKNTHGSAAVTPPLAQAKTHQTKAALSVLPLQTNISLPSVSAAVKTDGSKIPQAPGRPAGTVPAGQKDFTLNLNHLSPMKQAVVMAEILGTPKGMQ